jgi:hypothetical protein
MRKGRAILASAVIALSAAGSIAVVTVPAASASGVSAAATTSNGVVYNA